MDNQEKIKESEKKKKKKKRQVFESCQRTTKAMEYDGDGGDGGTSRNWRTWNGPQRLDNESGRRFGNRRTNVDRPNYVVETGQNTEKSPGDQRRLAVTQTPVKDHKEIIECVKLLEISEHAIVFIMIAIKN